MDRQSRVKKLYKGPEEKNLEDFEESLSPALFKKIQDFKATTTTRCDNLIEHNKIPYCGVGIYPPHLPKPDNYLSLAELQELCMGCPDRCHFNKNKYNSGKKYRKASGF